MIWGDNLAVIPTICVAQGAVPTVRRRLRGGSGVSHRERRGKLWFDTNDHHLFNRHLFKPHLFNHHRHSAVAAEMGKSLAYVCETRSIVPALPVLLGNG